MGWQLDTTDCANSDEESLYSCTTSCGFQAALHTPEARALCTGKLGLHPHQKMHLLVDGVGGNAVAAQMQPRTPGSTVFGTFSPLVVQREPQTWWKIPIFLTFPKICEIKQKRHRLEPSIRLCYWLSNQVKWSPDWMKAIQSNFHLRPGKGGLRT